MDDLIYRFRYAIDQRVSHAGMAGIHIVVDQRITRRAALAPLIEYLLRHPSGTTYWARERDIVDLERKQEGVTKKAYTL